MGFQTPHQLARPAILDGGYAAAASDISEYMDHIARHISSDASLDSTTGEFSVDNNTISTDNFPPPLVQSEYRPCKAPRRDYMSGASSNSGTKHSNVSAAKPASMSDEPVLNIITLLLECAVAISVDNLPDANRMPVELAQLASPASYAERGVAYFTKAMASRVMNSWLAFCSPLVPHRTILASFQAFNNISLPFIKFSHFTASQAILEVFHRRDRVHIVDLDITQGTQWPALFHILATRADGPPQARMTGLDASMESLQETVKQLSGFAKRLSMPFEFQPIARRFSDIDPAMVQPRHGEAVAVHWLQHSIGTDWATMRLLEAISPRVITLVGQEMVHGCPFLDRFVGSLHYYSTMFDSLGASMPVDDPSRHRVENGLLAREINSILVIGGPGRSGKEKFGSWRGELEGRPGVFAQLPMSSNAMAQAQLILNMFPPSLWYTMLQGGGTLRLGWKGTALHTASAWTSRLE